MNHASLKHYGHAETLGNNLQHCCATRDILYITMLWLQRAQKYEQNTCTRREEEEWKLCGLRQNKERLHYER